MRTQYLRIVLMLKLKFIYNSDAILRNFYENNISLASLRLLHRYLQDLCSLLEFITIEECLNSIINSGILDLLHLLILVLKLEFPTRFGNGGSTNSGLEEEPVTTSANRLSSAPSKHQSSTK